MRDRTGTTQDGSVTGHFISYLTPVAQGVIRSPDPIALHCYTMELGVAWLIYFLLCTITMISSGQARIGNKTRYGHHNRDRDREKYDRYRQINRRITPELVTPTKTSASPSGCSFQSSDISEESRLIQFLLYKYEMVGTFARPVRNSSMPVNIGFMMTLVQILDFDETKQLIISNVWKSYQWVDETLQWNPDDFGGIIDLRLPPSLVWTPDIVLYNNADEQYDREIHHELLAVLYNGTIKWIPSAIYKSSCEVDMTNFPFDDQNCFYKFGSWTYDGYKVNLDFLGNMSDIDFMEFMPSAEWDILEAGGYRNVRQYACCGDDPYPELIYTIHIKRKTAFYIVVLILPCVLLSCLTLVMFWFPPQRPDRTGLGMSLFSSFFVLLLILVQSSPPTSHSISLLGVYYCINMILIALSTLLSAVVINMFKSKGHKVPLPRWLLACRRQNWLRVLLRLQGVMVESQARQRQHHTSGTGTANTTKKPSKPEVKKVGLLEVDELGRTVIEWREIAKILDRVFFGLYIIGMVISLCIVFPR